METSELMGRVSGKIASLGAAFYFAPATVARGKELGLDGFRMYFIGRGGVLGDVEPVVVQSAFGYWNPGLVEKMWTTAKEKIAPREGARVYMAACADLGREKLAGVDGLAEFCEAAEAVIAAADPAGLALYAGLRGEPVPDDLPARAMHLIVVLRELRGSAHLAAVRAVGLTPRLAHQIKRGVDDAKMFGWQEPHLDISDADRALSAEAEALTDRMLADAFAVLTDAQATALADGIDRIEAAVAA